MTGGGQITALMLAGGRGARMGGADKGLQPFRGQPLARAVLERLSAQTLRPARIAISANRNGARYADIGAAFDAPVWPDGVADEFPGPLAGMLAGLRRAATPYLLTAPCDAPLLPLSLAERLAWALQGDCAAGLAVACGPDGEGGGARLQPVCCLLRCDPRHALADDLAAWLRAGHRKAGEWIARRRYLAVRFDAPGDDPRAFANANTREQLRILEKLNVKTDR